ncbi:MAG: outer membrane protein assembly factor BamD [Chlamydiia bacterium]
MRLQKVLLTGLCLLSGTHGLYAKETTSGFNPSHVALATDSPSADALHRNMVNSWDAAEWSDVLMYGEQLLEEFPSSPLAQEVPFLLGMAHYQLNESTLAVEQLDRYLLQSAPRRFVEALEVKLLIAEHWAAGGKKRLFDVRALPKWQSAHEQSIQLFDEVLASLPNHPLATRALLGKGKVLRQEGDLKGAMECSQQLIRKFPRDLLAQEAYVQLTEMYEEQGRTHFHDPNLLDQAELTVNKFERAFPGSPRIAEARLTLDRIRERYASGCLETARFYQKLGHPSAAAVYYGTVLRQYGKTAAVQEAKKGLLGLRKRGQLSQEFLPLIEEAAPVQSS